MIRNALFWIGQIQNYFIPQVDALIECFERRILPNFSDLKAEAEAEQVQMETFNRLRTLSNFDVDEDQLAERAQDAALFHFETIKDLQRTVTSMFTATIYHLFEQQLLLFHRQELLNQSEEQSSRLWHLCEVKKRLKVHKIDISLFSTWREIDELRLIANVIKHAEGNSAQKLKIQRPDLFVDNIAYLPISPPLDVIARLPVYLPLAGQDFYVSFDTFKKYAGAVREFWNELAASLENQQNTEDR